MIDVRHEFKLSHVQIDVVCSPELKGKETSSSQEPLAPQPPAPTKRARVRRHQLMPSAVKSTWHSFRSLPVLLWSVFLSGDTTLASAANTPSSSERYQSLSFFHLVVKQAYIEEMCHGHLWITFWPSFVMGVWPVIQIIHCTHSWMMWNEFCIHLRSILKEGSCGYRMHLFRERIWRIKEVPCPIRVTCPFKKT